MKRIPEPWRTVIQISALLCLTLIAGRTGTAFRAALSHCLCISAVLYFYRDFLLAIRRVVGNKDKPRGCTKSGSKNIGSVSPNRLRKRQFNDFVRMTAAGDRALARYVRADLGTISEPVPFPLTGKTLTRRGAVEELVELGAGFFTAEEAVRAHAPEDIAAAGYCAGFPDKNSGGAEKTWTVIDRLQYEYGKYLKKVGDQRPEGGNLYEYR